MSCFLVYTLCSYIYVNDSKFIVTKRVITKTTNTRVFYVFGIENNILCDFYSPLTFQRKP